MSSQPGMMADQHVASEPCGPRGSRSAWIRPRSEAPCRIRLSTIIPNYNHGAFVCAAIEALATQVPAPDEIVVVDDGSTDDSRDILGRLREKYPILRVVALGRNQGAINALNCGLREARGTYVYFGAADDVVLPGLFAAMLSALERWPEAAFASGEGIVVDTDTDQRAYRPPVRPAHAPAFLAADEVARSFRHIDNWILTGGAIVRRDLIVEAGGFDPALGAFADGYALRRLALLHGCCFVPQVGFEWRISARGLSRSQAADPAGSLRTLQIALEKMRTDPAFPLWYPALLERRWRFGIGRIAAVAHPMNRLVLERACARGPIGRAILKGAVALAGPLGRWIALGWLSLRERPMSFAGLLATYLSRAWRSDAPAVGTALHLRARVGS